MTYSRFLRTMFETPMASDLQAGFEQRMGSQIFNTIQHNPEQPETEGQGAPADYAGAPMGGGGGAPMPGADPMGGMGGMPGQDLQQIQPGMQQPPAGPGGPEDQQMQMAQESMMRDDFDLFLDALLDENVKGLPKNSLTEGPFDYYPGPAAGPTAHQPSNYGPGYGGYRGGYGGGYGAGGAPPASYYRTPAGNPDTSANALNRQELERITGDNPAYRPGGYPAMDYGADAPRGGGGGGGGRGGGGRNRGGGGGGGGGAARSPGRRGADSSDFVHSPDYVRAIQQNLKAAGFDVGRTGVDGIMGKYTRAAMKQAQDKGYEFSPGGALSQATPFNPKGSAGTDAAGATGGSTPGLAGAGAAATGAAAGAAAARMGRGAPTPTPAAGPGTIPTATPAAGAARPFNAYSPGAGTQPGITTAKPIQNPYLNMPNGRPAPVPTPAAPPKPGLNMPTPGIKDPYLNMPNPPRGSPTPAAPPAAPPGAPQQGGFFNRAWQTAKNLMGDTEGKAGLPAATPAATNAVTPAVPSAAKTALRVGGKVAGKVGGPVAGGIEAYNDYEKNHNVGRALGVGGGTMAGAVAGGAAGTAVGGPVGGVIGAGLGAAAGSPAGGWAYDKIAANPTLGPWGQAADKNAAGSFDPNSGLYVPSPKAQAVGPKPAAPTTAVATGGERSPTGQPLPNPPPNRAGERMPAGTPAPVPPERTAIQTSTKNGGSIGPAPAPAAPPEAPPAGGAKQQAEAKGWGLNWDDYNVLFEADRSNDKKERGYCAAFTYTGRS